MLVSYVNEEKDLRGLYHMHFGSLFIHVATSWFPFSFLSLCGLSGKPYVYFVLLFFHILRPCVIAFEFKI